MSEHILSRRDYLRRFKTTHREIFDQAWKTAEGQGAFDSLLFNSDGLLLEGGRSNVFVKYQGQWLTPSLDLDILNGGNAPSGIEAAAVIFRCGYDKGNTHHACHVGKCGRNPLKQRFKGRVCGFAP